MSNEQNENVRECGLRVGMLVRVSWGIPLNSWKTIEDWAWGGGTSGHVQIAPGHKGVVVAEYKIPPSTPGCVGLPAVTSYHPRDNVELRFNVLYQVLWEDERLTWSFPSHLLPLEKTPDCDPFFEKSDAVFGLK